MKALIDLQSVIKKIGSWRSVTEDGETFNQAQYVEITNSARIAQVEENEFEVCTSENTLLWVDCNTSVTTDGYYYDTSDSTIKPIVNADPPA